MRARFCRGVIALLLGVFAVSACSVFGSGSDSGANGYATASTKRVTVEYPGSWQRVPDKKADKKIDLLLREKQDGQPVAQIAIADVITHAPRVKFASQVLLHHQELSTVSLKRKGTRAVKVDGTKNARRVDYIYSGTSKNQKKTGHRIRGTDITIMGPRHEVSMVRVTGVKSKLSKSTVNHIVESIRYQAPSA